MYKFKEAEKQILDFWKKQRIYEKSKEKNKKGKNFYFLQGPPYTSGRMHIGHAWNNSLKDLILRYKRMKGFNVWDRAGYDMHGLPTENAVQKQLNLKDKKEIEKYGLDRFNEKCMEFSSKNAKIMDEDMKKLGIWFDYENAYWPIKQEFMEGEWWLIKKAHEQKRLYKGNKIMHWCSSCETSLAKHELEYKNVKDNSIFLKFKIKGKDKFLVIWTTTPWTIPFNLAIMVNPNLDYVEAEVDLGGKKEIWIVAKALVNVFVSGLLEKKFKILKEFKGDKLEKTEYEHPFESEMNYKELKKEHKNIHTVILSEEYVDTSAGSGLVHCAPGCGPEDYEVGKKYKIPGFNTINEKGVFENSGKFNNLIAKTNDKQFIEELEKTGNLITTTQVEHEYAHCWRCKNPVVFRATEHWFLKIEDLTSEILKYNKKVKWVPEFCGKNFNIWTENLKDNGISRQRYWGTALPIWECQNPDCNHTIVIENSEELKEKAGKVPKDLHRPWIDEIKIKCEKCKNYMHRVPDVIDVWIDSGTAGWNCLYYPYKKEYFKEYFPADLILEATEQVRLWYSMLQIASAIALKKSSYKTVYNHGMILDYQGMKMSKSLGNIISPYEVMDKYGSDILRYYMCATPAGENINFNWEEVKIKQKNMTVLYNILNYLLNLTKQTPKKQKNLDLEERYILSRKNSTLKKVTELLEKYRLDEIIREIEALFLDLSRVYIRFTRDKISDEKEKNKVASSIYETYLDILKMFSIVSPFITETIWQNLSENNLVSEESVHLNDWPKHNEKQIDTILEKEFNTALKIIEAGLAQRDLKKIGLKWPLAKAKVICEMKIEKQVLEIIKNQLNVKEIELKTTKTNEIKVELNTKITAELENEGFSRELMRKIQSLRKKASLVKEDIIELVVVADKLILNKFEKHKKEIAEKTNAKKILFLEKFESDDFETLEDKIKDNEIKIYLKKV